MERGIYRATIDKLGYEYAYVDYGTASDIGEVPRALYDTRGYAPEFDNLPTKAEFQTNAAESVKNLRLPQ